MYRPYQITTSEIDKLNTQYYVNKANSYKNFRDNIRCYLREKLNYNLILSSLSNGSRLQEFCFPSETIKSKFDVFISHSHTDEDEKGNISKLAKFLYEKYGIRSFIDSEYWSYCNDIIKGINKEIGNRKNNILQNGKKLITSDADDFLYISSNIYAMLSMAILRMIDNIPCVIFVNSENSLNLNINSNGKIGVATMSPWIYEEINYINSLKENCPDYYKSIIKESQECFSERFAFNVEIGNFRQLSAKTLSNLSINNREKSMCKIFDLYNSLPYNSNKQSDRYM